MSFLQIKIYRGKFIAYTVFVVSIGLAIGILTCAILLYQWVDNARNEAASAFIRVENTFQYNADRIEAYMQRVYSTSGLMADVRCFLDHSAEGYLTSRLQESRYNQPLVSFPDDMKSFLYSGGQGDIIQVSLHTEQRGNVIRFDNNGSASFMFQLPNTDEAFQESIHKGFVYRKKLSDPNQISRQLGEFRFLVSSDRIFRNVSNYRVEQAAIVSASRDVYPIVGANRHTEDLARQAVVDGRSQGYLSTGGLNGVFFVTFSSTKFDYQFVGLVDLGMMIRDKAGVLLSVFLIVLSAMISVLMLIVHNLRDDARFLHHIIHSMGRVKTADFTPETPARYRRNEYEMISRELEDMSRQLDKYIRTEYLLKLKQQETEMKALQNQINPHFLYNTLEAIRSRALVNSDVDTSDAIAALGALYRDIVKHENIITFDKELSLLQEYLKIMEFKYPDRFYYQINVEKALLSLPTVKFWMQPLAENFFVHGFNPSNGFNLLVINGCEAEEHFILEIVDNGKWIAEERLNEIRDTLYRKDDTPVKSIGLHNVHTRLHFFYGEGYAMKIGNNEEAGVKISVIIPKEVGLHVQTSDCG
ncbi:histidine kinase [Paenibacillus motobuensis]|uniref:sensor histidine kinase n=1 Tax=Paenibacillus TaxID=44249 RepID=UPI00203B8624|nr:MULTISPECIES: histidine kinase [Paenibacillus]MCM3040807.1 histidine kinase [Paenibacillus lutimineralis]MCM3647911.1 histidine kinase [Paenibacillus motobuensis]